MIAKYISKYIQAHTRVYIDTYSRLHRHKYANYFVWYCPKQGATPTFACKTRENRLTYAYMCLYIRHAYVRLQNKRRKRDKGKEKKSYAIHEGAIGAVAFGTKKRDK